MTTTPYKHLPKYNIGAHFLTAKTYRNTPYFQHPQPALTVCEELEAARSEYGFHVLAFVVMPDHIHLLLWWRAEEKPELTISKIAWAVKGKSARRVVDFLKRIQQKKEGGADTGVGEGIAPIGVGEGNAPTYPRSNEVGEGNEVDEGKALVYPELRPAHQPQDKPHRRNWWYRVWQPGAGYDFNIITAGKLREKVVYIHRNPVKAGLVSQPAGYPWSSYLNYLGEPAQHPVQITNYAEVS